MAETGKNVIITKSARKKMVRARAGEEPLPKIVGMVFGSGGVDEGGTVIPPTEEQTGLKNELLRKTVSGHTFPEETTCRYSCTLTETELVGAEISEIGLYDEQGDVVCIKTFMRKGKDGDVEMTYTIDDVF